MQNHLLTEAHFFNTLVNLHSQILGLQISKMISNKVLWILHKYRHNTIWQFFLK